MAGFTSEILCMMYVGGDVEEPDIHTAEFLENVVREEIRKLCYSLDFISVTLHDILFAVRHQKHLVVRLIRYLEMMDRKDRGRSDRMALVDESLTLWDWNNSVRHDLDGNTSNDKIHFARLKRQADRSELLSNNEYEHFAYCKGASFNGYKAQNPTNTPNPSSQQFPLKNTRMEQAGTVPKRLKLDRFRSWLLDEVKNYTQVR